MKDVIENRCGPRAGLPAAARALAWISLLGIAALALPSAAAAQTGQSSKGTTQSSVRPKGAAISPADSAACAQIIGYAFQHPEVLQKSEELRASGKTKRLSTLPDSVRTRVGAAIAKGQSDSLKAMARVYDPQSGDSLDSLIDFVTAFPDSVRSAVGTLVASGRSMTCS